MKQNHECDATFLQTIGAAGATGCDCKPPVGSNVMWSILKDFTMNSTPKPANQSGITPSPASPHDTANTLDGQETVTGGSLGDAAGDFDIARQVFAERFDHLAELGVGGMGRVLKAFDRRMHRTVAIKRLKTPGTVENELLL